MKKTVLKFGLISGGMAAVFMLATLPFMKDHGSLSLVVGYTSIVLAALVVFAAIRSYRNEVGGGRISFGRGLAIGVLVAAISALCYAATFQLVYFVLVPDFGDRFASTMVEQAQAEGKSDAEILEATEQAKTVKRLLDNPLSNIALCFIEPFPVGVGMAILAAAILRRR